MKKKYFAPNMEIVKIQMTGMLAASVPMYNQNATGEGMAPEGNEFEW